MKEKIIKILKKHSCNIKHGNSNLTIWNNVLLSDFFEDAARDIEILIKENK
jgi:hypothetical protein